MKVFFIVREYKNQKTGEIESFDTSIIGFTSREEAVDNLLAMNYQEIPGDEYVLETGKHTINAVINSLSVVLRGFY